MTGVGGRVGGTGQLVASVVAVGDAVALVRLVDALLAVGTLDLLAGAADRRTALLVLVVETVVVAVADPTLRDAVARARARELEVGARPLGARVALVAAVAAVVLRVALPRHRDAPVPAQSQIHFLLHFLAHFLPIELVSFYSMAFSNDFCHFFLFDLNLLRVFANFICSFF